MGCCVSRCRPRKRSLEECYSHVQDKLVISHAPSPPKAPKITIPIPTSPTTTSSSSVSSFACSNFNTNSTCSSLSSSGSSSILSSKDRSFSNEFLWSCVKENPHIVRINSIKECAGTNFMHPARFVTPERKSTPQRVITSSTQKRIRPSSPTTTTLTRQKSFRRDSERTDPPMYPTPCRSLRSSSPSRRFNGDNTRGVAVASAFSSKECGSRRFVGSKANLAANSVSSCSKKDNLRPASCYLNNGHLHSGLSRETCIHRISSKANEITEEQAPAQHDHNDSIALEDVDNPLISLDCFIFL